MISWVKQELKARSWSQRELARHSSLTHAYIAKILRGEMPVTWNFCAEVAHALDEPVWKVFTLAGLVNEVPPELVADEETNLVIKIFNELPEHARKDTLNYLKWLAIQHKKD